MKKLQLRKKDHDNYIASIPVINDRRRPNIVLVFVDDLGYGDLSCFGSQIIKTPCIDCLAQKGAKLNHFYAASPVCSPSRFSCLTGRYPTRGFLNNVFFPSVTIGGRFFNRTHFPYGVNGILEDEITVAEALRASGYRTGIFGKWHLGDKSPHRPTDKGFETFYGSYYSVDMEPYRIYRNEKIEIENVDKSQLTKQLTDEILNYIEQNQNEPFFIYYASPYPHFPVAASKDFSGKSKGGAYGDCVEELDWSVGQIYSRLEKLSLTENTLFIFTSDNGPWFEGSVGNHRGRKGQNFDGGHVVPFIAVWPGQISAGAEIDETAMNIDFFPTFLKMAGIPLPADREIDGKDMMPLLSGTKKENVHEVMYFIYGDRVQAVRTNDDLKYMVRTQCDNANYANMEQGPFLFDMKNDKNESYDVRKRFPNEEKRMQRLITSGNRSIKINPRGWKR